VPLYARNGDGIKTEGAEAHAIVHKQAHGDSVRITHIELES